MAVITRFMPGELVPGKSRAFTHETARIDLIE
jgi:hypothetical protein